MMGWDRVTIWHLSSPGVWSRTVLSGVRVEENEAIVDTSTPSPIPSWSIRVFVFNAKNIELGDFMAKGVWSDKEPCDVAHRITSIDRYSTHFKHHHTEVRG